jgi:hypothetical protein
MTTKKTTDEPKKTTKRGTQPGKVKGAATVTPAAEKPPEDQATAKELATEEEVSRQKVGDILNQAYEAGYLASQRGTPNRPPLGYTDVEVRAWYAGYKSHANPNSRRSLVEGEDGQAEGGYRKDY